MIAFQHLVGLPFKHGETDCYELCRRFYDDNFGIKLPNYARPDDWWDQGLNLYQDNFHKEGFRLIDSHPRDWQPGDGFLMCVRSAVPNHAAIYLGGNRILHHLANQLSAVEPYRGFWRTATVAVLRHKDATPVTQEQTHVDLVDLLPAAQRQKVRDALHGV